MTEVLDKPISTQMMPKHTGNGRPVGIGDITQTTRGYKIEGT